MERSEMTEKTKNTKLADGKQKAGKTGKFA
jgi:hypothetical protein